MRPNESWRSDGECIRTPEDVYAASWAFASSEYCPFSFTKSETLLAQYGQHQLQWLALTQRIPSQWYAYARKFILPSTEPPILGGILFSCMCVMWPITDTATNPHVSVAVIIVARVSSFILVLINILLRSAFLKTFSTELCLKVEVYFWMLAIQKCRRVLLLKSCLH